MYVGMGIVKTDTFQSGWLREEEIMITEGQLGMVCLKTQLSDSLSSIRQYNEVLCRIILQTTIIPLRFGTLFDEESQIQDILSQRLETYNRLFQKLEHQIEVGLAISWDKDQFAQEMLGDKSLLRWKKALESGKGQGYDIVEFGKAVEEHANRKRNKIERLVLEVLGPLAKAYQIKSCTEELQGFNGFFLVSRSQEEEFDQAVDTLSQKLSLGYQFKYTGPWPAHHFLDF